MKITITDNDFIIGDNTIRIKQNIVIEYNGGPVDISVFADNIASMLNRENKEHNRSKKAYNPNRETTA